MMHQQLITNYYSRTPTSIVMKAYNGLYNYLKNKMFSENTLRLNYKQKLITDYYKHVPKQVKSYNNFNQPLITKYYRKN